MLSALPVLRSEAQKLKALAARGQLSTAALTAAGTAILAAQAALADHETTGETDPDTVVIGQTLIGATHTHENGLTHNHGPLSLSPTGPAHVHAITLGQAPALSQAPVMPQASAIPHLAHPQAAMPASAGLSGLYTGNAATSTAGAPYALSGYPGLVVTPYNAEAMAASAGANQGLLLALGLAGLTGLAALVLWGDGADAWPFGSQSTSAPYLSSGSAGSSSSASSGASSTAAASTSNGQAPVINSATLQLVDEGETGSFTVVTALDPQNDSLSFSLVGGADQAQFSINPVTGVLSYIDPTAPTKGDANNSDPDFSAPSGDADGTTAANGDNSLEVTVKVSDPAGNSDTETLTFFVQNERRDDVVSDYREADDLARLPHQDTNTLADMTEAAAGQDAQGANLLFSVDGDAVVRVTELAGDGSISTSSFGTSGADYHDLAVGDIDGDGNLDVALVGQDSSGDNRVEVWESNGSGSFSLEYTASDGSSSSTLDNSGTARDIVMGDFDGSGHLDLFVINDGGEESLITLTGKYSGTILTFSGLQAEEEAEIIDESDLTVSTDYVVALDGGDISLINPEDSELVDQQSGAYVDLAVFEDLVFAAEDDHVDVYEADSNSLDVEVSGLITGGDTITEIMIGDFDTDHGDAELAVLDSGDNVVRIYDLHSGYDEATLLYTLDVPASAEELLSLPAFFEALEESGGNLADDLLVGGGDSTIFYDETSL